MKRLKYIPWALGVIAIIGLIVWLIFGVYPAFKGWLKSDESAGGLYVGPPAEEVGLPAEAEPVPVVEDALTFTERLNPLHIRTEAEERTADLPPGTEVYVITDDEGEETVIYRTQAGYVYKEGEADVEAYSTPAAFLAAEFRPKIMATTDFATAGIAAELDVVRVGSVHAGPAAGVYFDRTGWVGAGVGYNAFRNVDVGGYGGKALGDEGWTGGISVGIAIE